jgi:uncharacterized phage protein (TIGR02216 family)
MALGLGVLRLPPAAFWSLTPRELDAAIRGLTGSPVPHPPRRSDLEQLMNRFPD